MSQTRTGTFPIGFRHGGSTWQQDLTALVAWACQHRFLSIDTGPLKPDELKQITEAGLKIGSVDLLQPWSALVSPDPARRRDAAQANADYIRRVVPAGANVFFSVALPDEPHRDRAENLRFAVDGYGQLVQSIKATGARIVLEGWPGGAPHYAALACTPESCRILFKEIGSNILGVNFDPSHLIRMGIDPVRFLAEFIDRVYHVHAKDTEMLDEAIYEYGHLQPAVAAKPHGWGGHAWRYTIPGHGQVRWSKLLSILAANQYRGLLSIELEDENFNGTEEGEKRGLIASRDYLVHV